MKFGPEKFGLLSALTIIFLCSVCYGDNTNVPRAEGFVCGTQSDTDKHATSLIESESETTIRSLYNVLPKQRSPGFSNQNVLWKVTKYPESYNKHTTVESVDAAISEAFQLWSSVCNLNFYQYLFGNSSQHHIEIKFDYPVGHKKYCSKYFLLKEYGHYVAESTNPARIHMNADVPWTTDQFNNTDNSINLIFVLAHEIGHVMGFGHNNFNDSVMYRHYYRSNSSGIVALSSEDIAAAVRRYGHKLGGPDHKYPGETLVPTSPSIWDSLRDLPKMVWRNLLAAAAKN